MARKKQPLTPQQALEQEYTKEMKRIDRIIANIAEQGFIVNQTIIKTPKRITRKHLAQLKEIKTPQIREKSQFFIPEENIWLPYKGNKTKIQKYRKSQRQQIREAEQQAYAQYATDGKKHEPTAVQADLFQVIVDRINDLPTYEPFLKGVGDQSATYNRRINSPEVMNARKQLMINALLEAVQADPDSAYEYYSSKQEEISDLVSIIEGYGDSTDVSNYERNMSALIQLVVGHIPTMQDFDFLDSNYDLPFD